MADIAGNFGEVGWHKDWDFLAVGIDLGAADCSQAENCIRAGSCIEESVAFEGNSLIEYAAGFHKAVPEEHLEELLEPHHEGPLGPPLAGLAYSW